MAGRLPSPARNESPTAYADRVGRLYAATAAEPQRRALGQYFTPSQIAVFMASLLKPERGMARILDPGAGTGILACAAAERLAQAEPRPSCLEITAYEVDPELCRLLSSSLAYLADSLEARGVRVTTRIAQADFILDNAALLDSTRGLFPGAQGQPCHEVVVMNPPYFKLPKSDLRARAARAVVHGQPNMYALFLAVASRALKRGGQLVAITPRSFCSGPYFRAFREQFFQAMVPERLHVFESRRDAFRRYDVLQENVILKARRDDGWHSMVRPQPLLVGLSASVGADDLRTATVRHVTLGGVLDMQGSDKVLRIPATTEDESVAEMLDAWRGSLAAYGLQVSTGPVVPFRARPLLFHSATGDTSVAPLLWMQNVHAMRVEWPVGLRNKPQYIATSRKALPLLLPDRTYVLLRRFSSKEQPRRLIAAPLLAGQLSSPWIGVENHVNYVHRVHGTLTADEARGLAALYNSSLMDRYFRTLNGSTQVGAAEVRSMPLPPLEAIREIGRSLEAGKDLESEAELLAATVLQGAR